MSRADKIALIISLISIFVTYFVTQRYFEAMPHLEDEVAYVWQAEAIAQGQLTVPSPPESESFLVPFVVDYQGQRFGKYPLGWPALLGIAIHFGLRSWINPLLAGLAVWLTYRLGKKLMGETVGILAAVLTVTSPFFLLNSGSLLSHLFGLVLSAAFALAWINGFNNKNSQPRILTTLVAGLCLGILALTRPLTAVAIAFPFGIHGIILLLRGNWNTRRHVIAVGILVGAIASLTFLWQYVVTGDPLLNPYTLWWPYDRIGFGPGIGRVAGGHNLNVARINTKFSLRVGYSDLFGWGTFSWIFLPFGLLAVFLRRNWRALLIGSVFPSLVLFYLAYWVGAWLYGPRYYFEGLYSLTIFSAIGIAWLAGWPLQAGEYWPRFSGWRRVRPLLVTGLVLLLVAGNLVFYTPIRLQGMYGLYQMSRSDLAPFQTEQAQELTPALIIVHPKRWMNYGVLLELSDPFLDTPFIFVYSRGPRPDREVAQYFPDRSVYHYYTDEPYRFYANPRQE
jgi:hypothetical protein